MDPFSSVINFSFFVSGHFLRLDSLLMQLFVTLIYIWIPSAFISGSVALKWMMQ